MRRGEIYWYDLGAPIGSEQGGLRPVLIIQNNAGNSSSTTTIIAAITTSEIKKPYPFHVEVEPKDCGLSHEGVVLLEQIQTVSKSRLGQLAGSLTQEKMREVDLALKISLGLN